MSKISEHITLAEAIKSQQAVRMGIDNSPTPEHLANMKHVAENVFEPLRKFFGKPIGISSFYRSAELNKAIKGSSKTSQHLTGEAMDIDGDIFGGVSNVGIFKYVLNNLNFDQLIWEFGNDTNPDWVHISLTKGTNRKQVLIAYKENGSTKYKPYKK